MKNKYRMFRSGKSGYYYWQDNDTGKQGTLGTPDDREAQRLLNAKNESSSMPATAINLQIARAYLNAADPKLVSRTWQEVMDELVALKRGTNGLRWERAVHDHSFDSIRRLPLIETRSDHFLKVLEEGKVSSNLYLRRIHNFALAMDWLLKPVIPKASWPILLDATGAQGQAKAALESGALHGASRRGSAQAVVAFGREDPAWVPVGAPELAQQFERALGQGHVTVAVAFARPDVEEHALRINVADFQLEGFAQAQPTGIDGRQGHAVVQGLDLRQDPANLGGRKNDRQFELGSRPRQLQLRRPSPLEGLLPEELDGAEGLGGTLAGEAALGFQIDEVLAEFFGAEQVGRAAEVFGELPHTGPVTLLAARLKRQQGQIIGEALQDCVGGTFFICIAAILTG